MLWWLFAAAALQAAFASPECAGSTVASLLLEMLHPLACRMHMMVGNIFLEAVGIHNMGRSLAEEAGDARREAMFTR